MAEWGTSPHGLVLSACRRLRLNHRVVGLALEAGGAGGIGKCGKLSRSAVNPAEHVGLQIDGGSGCRADAASAESLRASLHARAAAAFARATGQQQQ